MTQQIIAQFHCPGCGTVLMPGDATVTRCVICAWRGEAYLFTPTTITASAAELAMPDDATCIHHPRKKATAVCAGTGDYICSLCAVDVNGQTFSAQYLSGAGRVTVAKAFDRVLRRPDSQARLYCVMLFIPYVNALAALFAFIWIPHGFYLYFKALRLRREDPLFGRLMSMSRVILLPIVLSIIALSWLGGVVALVLFSLGKLS